LVVGLGGLACLSSQAGLSRISLLKLLVVSDRAAGYEKPPAYPSLYT